MDLPRMWTRNNKSKEVFAEEIKCLLNFTLYFVLPYKHSQFKYNKLSYSNWTSKVHQMYRENDGSNEI